MKKYGIMIDLSRGKVLKVSKLKEIISISKMFGYTYINLYLEDLITLDEYPQFGYMRGKYTDEEITEIVEYAIECGIEIYPAIQTLGHLEHFLQWKDSSDLKDTEKVLNVLSEDTILFIECLIKKCKKLFKSNNINIGMDEAFDLGMGEVFRKTGKIDQKSLYFDFQKKVVSICKKNGFDNVKIWSDMVYSVYTNTGGEGLYTDISNQNVEKIDDNIELVFWNYWSQESEVYSKMIDSHRKLTENVSVALGIHTWGEISYLEEKLEVTKTALEVCEEKEIDDVLFTMWGDDGSIYNLDTAIFGMYLTSRVFKKLSVDKEEFEKITKINYDSAQKLANITKIGVNPLAIFWNDPITNIFFNSKTSEQLDEILNNVNSLHSDNNDEISIFYNLVKKIISVEILNYTKSNYDFSIIELYKELLNWYEEKWFQEAKLNGIEEIQKRIATKIYRLEFLEKSINNEEITAIINDSSYSNYKVDLKYGSISCATNSRW